MTAYSDRVAEYVHLLDSMGAVHPSDRQLVTEWATSVSGPIVDVGCGPGHWTDHLASLGHDVRGIDPTPEFVEHASRRYPGRKFDVGVAEKLQGPVGGILAWYSLIHHTPDEISAPLQEFARVLGPGGSLLIGFFEAPELGPFDHAVTTAYRWPVPALTDRLGAFDVVETHTRTGVGCRPHGAIVATVKT